MPFIDVKDLPVYEIVPGYQARIIHSGNLTLVYWSVEEGAEIAMHHHLHEQVAHVLTGSFSLTIGNETKVLEPGRVAVIPPHAKHGGKALTACELLDVFYPEREDYKFPAHDQS
jgi:quercetin dioxygenase-like cupin family protein